jgi:predicted NAD/FAD-binding protein
MLGDLIRFYRNAATQIGDDPSITLGEFLTYQGYSSEFVQDHLLPFGAAIWSTPRHKMLDYPAMSFIRFCENHGLLKITGRPQWRTVSNGSVRYVDAVRNAIGAESVITGFDAACVSRESGNVIVTDSHGHTVQADHVVLATHADQALRLLQSPSSAEQKLLSEFKYESNRAYLHTDSNCMPKRRRAWCSWNYVEKDVDASSEVQVSYWMNRLQNIRSTTDYFVTLNPECRPSDQCLLRESVYEHPVFNRETLSAQHQLWSLQGNQRTWFCGSYFGAGFHEDAIQSGFAVAEQLGGRLRPWKLQNPSTRIILHPSEQMIQPEPSGAAV